MSVEPKQTMQPNFPDSPYLSQNRVWSAPPDICHAGGNEDVCAFGAATAVIVIVLPEALISIQSHASAQEEKEIRVSWFLSLLTPTPSFPSSPGLSLSPEHKYERPLIGLQSPSVPEEAPLCWKIGYSAYHLFIIRSLIPWHRHPHWDPLTALLLTSSHKRCHRQQKDIEGASSWSLSVLLVMSNTWGLLEPSKNVRKTTYTKTVTQNSASREMETK